VYLLLRLASVGHPLMLGRLCMTDHNSDKVESVMHYHRMFIGEQVPSMGNQTHRWAVDSSLDFHWRLVESLIILQALTSQEATMMMSKRLLL